jgi:hypothetical protein
MQLVLSSMLAGRHLSTRSWSSFAATSSRTAADTSAGDTCAHARGLYLSLEHSRPCLPYNGEDEVSQEPGLPGRPCRRRKLVHTSDLSGCNRLLVSKPNCSLIAHLCESGSCVYMGGQAVA